MANYSPQSGVRGVHINRDLTNFSVMYRGQGYIADQIFPVFGVKNESDDYWSWDKGQAFREGRADGLDTLVADGAASEEESYGATIKQYRTRAFKRKTRITDRERNNADDSLQLERNKIQLVQDKILRGYELRVANIVTSTSTYAASNFVTLSGANQWNNASFVSQSSQVQSTIVQNIETGMDAIRKATGGLLPNTIILPFGVEMVMNADKGLNDSIKYTQAKFGGLIPDTWMGMRVLRPQAMFTTALEGENVTLGDIWGKHVVLAYVNPNPGLNCLTFGTTFRSRNWLVRQWRNEELESTYYEPSIIQDERLITADCAYLIANAIA